MACREGDSEEEAPKARKKHKTEGGVAEEAGAVVEGTVAAELEGHSGCVASVCWPEHHDIFTASWDRAVRKVSFECKVEHCGTMESASANHRCSSIYSSINYDSLIMTTSPNAYLRWITYINR